MYIVHMKRMTASEARRRWFAVLDEVAEGEIVAIIRKGKRIILRRDDPPHGNRRKLPDYASILRIPNADRADSWGWEWTTSGVNLRVRERRKR